jgi:hypothetical protein
MKKNLDNFGFSWYKSDRPGVFNPYNISDRTSRKVWYENVTLVEKKVSEKKHPVPKVEYPSNLVYSLINARTGESS